MGSILSVLPCLKIPSCASPPSVASPGRQSLLHQTFERSTHCTGIPPETVTTTKEVSCGFRHTSRSGFLTAFGFTPPTFTLSIVSAPRSGYNHRGTPGQIGLSSTASQTPLPSPPTRVPYSQLLEQLVPTRLHKPLAQAHF